MKMLITGGAGFIGANATLGFLNQVEKIYVYDNFSRITSEINARFLAKQSSKIRIIEGDVKDFVKLKDLVKKVDIVLHLAGQVAVTNSLKDPKADFDTNLIGSFNVLEAARRFNPKITLLYASTNKVYGNLSKIKIDKQKGIDETTPIDLYSPYGCSKGAADLYFLDYYRSYGIKTVVFRQSCIYGPWQYGLEDQGWLAFFALQIINKKPITIFGNGKQVRDLLYIYDLIKLYRLVVEQVDKAKGNAFNVGGGPENSLSLLQAISLLEKQIGQKAKLSFGPKRLGDQDYFASNNNKAKKLLSWRPEIFVKNGLDKLTSWCQENI